MVLLYLRRGLLMFGLGLLLSSCVALPQGGTRLNLSPLLFYQGNEDQGRLELLGPLFAQQWQTGRHAVTVAPLFHWQRHPEGIQAAFLYPFGHYRQGAEGSLLHLPPWGRFDADLPEGATAWHFFPFFGGRTAAGESYGGVFPLGGTFKERFGRDSITFILWPLFSTSAGDGSRHYKILWPFFSYSTGAESAFTFWPFYGRIDKPGHYEKFYALWPFIHSQRLGLDTDKPRTLKAVLPFYLKDTTPTSSRTGIFYPFFCHYTQEEGRYEQWDTPWPLVIRGDGENFRLRAWRPFYYRRDELHQQELHLLWPLYQHSRAETDTSLDVFTRYLFLSMHRVRIDDTGAWEEKSRLWPLMFSESRPGFLKAHAPELLPLQDDGWERLFGPWLYLWSHEEQPQLRQGRSLWGLMRWEATPTYRLWEVSFLAARYTTAQGSLFRLLSGLLTLERRGDTRSLRLFYLPWGWSWTVAGEDEKDFQGGG